MTVSADPNEGLATGVAGVVTDQVSGEPIAEVVVNVAAQDGLRRRAPRAGSRSPT